MLVLNGKHWDQHRNTSKESTQNTVKPALGTAAAPTPRVKVETLQAGGHSNTRPAQAGSQAWARSKPPGLLNSL